MTKTGAFQLPATSENAAAFWNLFTCRHCGICCNVFDAVRIYATEMKRLKVPQAEHDEIFMQIGRFYYMKEPCRFYDSKKNMCTIYDLRPATCRNFPVHNVRGANGQMLLEISKTCPAAIEALKKIEMKQDQNE
jgi:Fe-S-cluster containining protein